MNSILLCLLLNLIPPGEYIHSETITYTEPEIIIPNACYTVVHALGSDHLEISENGDRVTLTGLWRREDE